MAAAAVLTPSIGEKREEGLFKTLKKTCWTREWSLHIRTVRQGEFWQVTMALLDKHSNGSRLLRQLDFTSEDKKPSQRASLSFIVVEAYPLMHYLFFISGMCTSLHLLRFHEPHGPRGSLLHVQGQLFKVHDAPSLRGTRYPGPPPEPLSNPFLSPRILGLRAAIFVVLAKLQAEGARRNVFHGAKQFC